MVRIDDGYSPSAFSHSFWQQSGNGFAWDSPEN